MYYLVRFNREEIREQQQIAEEINNAIINIGDPADEEELRMELAAMEQEALDNKMLTAPSAPIASTPQHVGAGKFIISVHNQRYLLS